MLRSGSSGRKEARNMNQIQVLARYNSNEKFGEWQVGTFAHQKDAKAYCDRMIANVYHKYPEFEFQLIEITEEAANKFNRMLNSLID
jgi:hypothetical protein